MAFKSKTSKFNPLIIGAVIGLVIGSLLPDFLSPIALIKKLKPSA